MRDSASNITVIAATFSYTGFIGLITTINTVFLGDVIALGNWREKKKKRITCMRVSELLQQSKQANYKALT